MQGAQKLRSEVPEGLAPQGPHRKVEAQRRRWTFYEVIKIGCPELGKSPFSNYLGPHDRLFLRHRFFLRLDFCIPISIYSG